MRQVSYEDRHLNGVHRNANPDMNPILRRMWNRLASIEVEGFNQEFDIYTIVMFHVTHQREGHYKGAYPRVHRNVSK